MTAPFSTPDSMPSPGHSQVPNKAYANCQPLPRTPVLQPNAFSTSLDSSVPVPTLFPTNTPIPKGNWPLLGPFSGNQSLTTCTASLPLDTIATLPYPTFTLAIPLISLVSKTPC